MSLPLRLRSRTQLALGLSITAIGSVLNAASAAHWLRHAVA